MESLLEILNLKDNIGVAFLGIFLWYVINSLKSDMKDGFQKLDARIDKLDSKVDSVRSELKSDIKEFREELKSDIREVREELCTKIDSVRNELKNEFNNKFDKLSTEVMNLDRTVIRFESHRELENRFEKMLSDTVAQQLLAEKKAQSNT